MEHIPKYTTLTKLLAPQLAAQKQTGKTRPNKLLVYLSDQTKPCSNVLPNRNTNQLNIRHLLPARHQSRKNNFLGTEHVCR